MFFSSFFFSLQHQNKTYACTLIQWYSYVGTQPDEDTGLQKVELDTKDDGNPCLAVIHIHAIFHAVHLIPTYCTAKFISKTITMHSSLDMFDLFYVNWFADHHLFANLWIILSTLVIAFKANGADSTKVCFCCSSPISLLFWQALLVLQTYIW